METLKLWLTEIDHHTMTGRLGLVVERKDQNHLESVFQILHEMDIDLESNEFPKLNLESLLGIHC